MLPASESGLIMKALTARQTKFPIAFKQRRFLIATSLCSSTALRFVFTPIHSAQFTPSDSHKQHPTLSKVARNLASSHFLLSVYRASQHSIGTQKRFISRKFCTRIVSGWRRSVAGEEAWWHRPWLDSPRGGKYVAR